MLGLTDLKAEINKAKKAKKKALLSAFFIVILNENAII